MSYRIEFAVRPYLLGRNISGKFEKVPRSQPKFKICIFRDDIAHFSNK
jgi:hypothetical protein